MQQYKQAEMGGARHGGYNALNLYTSHHGGPELKAEALEMESMDMSDRDPEPKYWDATLLAYVGQKDVALRLLRRSVEQNFCAVYGLDHDPLLANLRGDPEFASIRSAAVDCQKRFLAHRQEKGPIPQH